jgi:hypothetical protein
MFYMTDATRASAKSFQGKVSLLVEHSLELDEQLR